MTFYFDENDRNQLKWTETSAREYSAQTAKIHYSALSNSAQKSSTNTVKMLKAEKNPAE
jgi:hypothetical protein